MIRVWEIDDGALWWVAAETLPEAVSFYLVTIAESGDDPEDLAVKPIANERAREIRIEMGDEKKHTVWSIAMTHGAGLIGCSEW